MHRRRNAFATLTVCLMVVAGCGSSSNPTTQFKNGYAAARGPLNTTFSEVSSALRGTARGGAAVTAGTVEVLAARFGTDLAPLKALKPPGQVATAFATLTASLGRVESDLREISAAAKRRSFGGAVVAVEKLESDARAATDAASAMKRKLYAT